MAVELCDYWPKDSPRGLIVESRVNPCHNGSFIVDLYQGGNEASDSQLACGRSCFAINNGHQRITSTSFTPSENKKRITTLFSFLAQIDIGDAMLNGPLQRLRGKKYCQLLWKENCTNPFTF
ncbi:hypothetical protein TNCV_2609061 [Trichonephila clavipes]|nr:hypothetical protein TNCV_2609061 [Trichonephila clavipes]